MGRADGRSKTLNEATLLLKYSKKLNEKIMRHRASDRERAERSAEAAREKHAFIRLRDSLPLDADEARDDVAAASALADAAQRVDAGEGGGIAGPGVALLEGNAGRARAFRAFRGACDLADKIDDEAYLLDEAEAEEHGAMSFRTQSSTCGRDGAAWLFQVERSRQDHAHRIRTITDTTRFVVSSRASGHDQTHASKLIHPRLTAERNQTLWRTTTRHGRPRDAPRAPHRA